MKDKIHIIIGSIITVLLLVLILKPTTGKFTITGSSQSNSAFLLDTTNGNTWYIASGGKILIKEK